MDVVFLVARILYVALFLSSAVGHLTQSEAMGQYAESRGLPAGRVLTLASGVLLLVGSVLVLLGVWGDLGSLLLFVFLLSTAVLMHGFWKETEPQAKQMEMVQFNKDIALAGASLAFLWVFSEGVGLTLTDGLF